MICTTKLINMRKIIILIAILFIYQVQAQEKNKLKIKSIDYGVIGVYTNLEKNGIRGFCTNIELITDYQKSLFSFNYTAGFGITKNENKIHDLQGFMSADLIYGREITISKVISFEPYLGLSYIIQSNTSEAGGKSAIGLPIKAKLFFQTGKKFAIGINPNVNINNVNTIYSANLLLRFKFK